MADGLAEAKDGIARTAIFSLISRFNHACVPNTFPAWSARLGKQTIHALRDIAPGEELCIAYVAGAESGARSHRQALLKRKYHFVCDCATCSLTGPALVASDERQRRMAKIHQMLSSDGTGSSSGEHGDAGGAGELIAMVEEHVRLMKEEGLPPIWGKAGLFLAIVELMKAGEKRAAAECARRGASLARVALGGDAATTLKFVQLAESLADAST